MSTDRSVTDHADAVVGLAGRSRRPEDRDIVRAALALFVERGFAATKLDDVARAASVSKGLPYLYFRSNTLHVHQMQQESPIDSINPGLCIC